MSRHKKIITASKTIRRGAATVEFAMVLPVLVILSLGAIDVGQLVNVGQTVSDVARHAARFAAKNTSLNTADVEARVKDHFAKRFPGVATDTLNAALNVKVTDEAGVSISGGNLTSLDPGSPVIVEVTFEFKAVRWMTGLGLGNSSKLETTSMARRE